MKPGQRVLKTIDSRKSTREKAAREIEELIRSGQIRFEKCELVEAKKVFLHAYHLAQDLRDARLESEAIVWLLRHASEALDEKEISKWNSKLNVLIRKDEAATTPLVWYGKGVAALYDSEHAAAMGFFHRFLRVSRGDAYAEARAWVGLAQVAIYSGKLVRGRWILESILKRYGDLQLRSINGVTHLSLASICEKTGDLKRAYSHAQQAHAAYLEEHNWYHYLYVLFWYARIARNQRHYSQARWNLDLIDRATARDDFGVLQREVKKERQKLDLEAIDLLIDARRGLVKIRNQSPVSLGKQYVLLDILKALSLAHEAGKDGKGLTKAEIIQQVWHEKYRPEAHDNKLYYNINRLRKLIEPNMKSPVFLLNWKEGYRLAPGLNVQVIASGDSQIESGGDERHA